MILREKHNPHTTLAGGSGRRMIEFAAFPTAAQAALVVTLVLVEALVLYAGYGVVEDRLAPPILEIIANTA